MSKDNRDYFKTKSRWSEIKDELLGCYLTPYFQKMLRTGKPILYVDCFAGKGKFDDGAPGSPLIALKARDGCLSNTRGNGRIDMCFIDLNYANDLSANISGFGNGYGLTQVVSGRYEEQIEDILRRKQGLNVFLYIDPYGIKALDSALFDKYEAFGFHTLEMLINFNSFGFFRDACRVMQVDSTHDEALKNLEDLVEYEPTIVDASLQSEEMLTGIAGGSYWKEIVVDYRDGEIDGYQAEMRLSAEYKKQLRKRYAYVLDMPIRLKAGQRPKYRMIHVCNHRDGCFLMAENMLKRKDELFISVQQRGQLSLFDIDSGFSSTAENELVTTDYIRTKLQEHLSGVSCETRLTELLAGFVNNYGLLCEFQSICSILREMEATGSIEIERSPALKQNGKPTEFWREAKGKTVVVRRCRQ